MLIILDMWGQIGRIISAISDMVGYMLHVFLFIRGSICLSFSVFSAEMFLSLFFKLTAQMRLVVLLNNVSIWSLK